MGAIVTIRMASFFSCEGWPRVLIPPTKISLSYLGKTKVNILKPVPKRTFGYVKLSVQ